MVMCEIVLALPYRPAAQVLVQHIQYMVVILKLNMNWWVGGLANAAATQPVDTISSANDTVLEPF